MGVISVVFSHSFVYKSGNKNPSNAHISAVPNKAAGANYCGFIVNAIDEKLQWFVTRKKTRGQPILLNRIDISYICPFSIRLRFKHPVCNNVQFLFFYSKLLVQNVKHDRRSVND